MKTLFIRCLLILVVLCSISCKELNGNPSSATTSKIKNTKEAAQTIETDEVNEAEDTLTVIPILDVTKETNQIVQGNPFDTKIMNQSILNGTTLYTVTNQGVIFRTDVFSDTFETIYNPSWAGIGKESLDIAVAWNTILTIQPQDKLTKVLTLLNLEMKTEKSNSFDALISPIALCEQNMYRLSHGAGSDYYIYAIDKDLQGRWQYPHSENGVYITSVWEWKGVCHIITASQESSDEMWHIAIDPVTGTVILKERIENEQSAFRNSKIDTTFFNTVFQNHELWIEGADENGLYMQSFQITEDHSIVEIWKQHFTSSEWANNQSSRKGSYGIQYTEYQNKACLVSSVWEEDSTGKEQSCYLVCLDATSGDIIWQSDTNWQSNHYAPLQMKIHPAGNVLLVDSSGFSTEKSEDLHTFAGLDMKTGRVLWKKSFTSGPVDEKPERNLQVFTDNDSFLIWNCNERKLQKIASSDGTVASYRFPAHYQQSSAAFFSSSYHTYIHINEWENNEASTLYSMVYKIE
ncbi:MAG: PQQ-binding-like beta-propeller repeat protein [Caldisericia bacterium]|nr:PQQ-binding-like beta-propeller repeat protein [Caldisericia bacterium]